jgi:dihydrofolate reductase
VWNGTLLKGELVDEVARLKGQAGQTILIYGSGQLVNALHPHGLIDEYRLMVFPVTVGTESTSLERGGARST